ncbi:SDR family oxidoreductase [Paroceanicella profunda]|uniref:SDR family oxidoreductase n=1 Tax=Paroceanicella profunda TaxID=2579971 RepID=A0A5B8FX55_9RHOB|nr:SDR family oxidoreductase [Paroceanicella profunda]QDL91032.1 SDR family oxidoreductase [Paroceanicella profunda]
MDLGLSGMNVLVTGGSKGIGRHCVDIFAAEGANVAFCARNAEEVAAAETALSGSLGLIKGTSVDVSDKGALEAWVAGSAASMGGIDILVANVSALALGDDEAAWEAGFATDMMHTVRLVNAALPQLEKSAAGSICAVSSVSGREADFTGPAYGAFKAALVHYMQRMALELAPKMIRCNTVSPGNTYFKGGVWENVEQNNPELFARALALNPTGRMGRPDEVARAVVFLSSPASSFTTGTNLVVDGALTRGIQL